MKTVILCGGFGTRLAEETGLRPKPMVDIGGRPILWHIMKIYSHYGFNEFSLALGYKGNFIKEYFLNYHALNSDLSVNLATGDVNFNNSSRLDWKVDLFDTGTHSMTGGRLHRLDKHLRPHGTFMMTYGDGVANVNLKQLLEFHKNHGKKCSVTAVKPDARFGGLTIEGGKVSHFREKPQSGEGWINGGFFVLEPEVLDYIESDDVNFEKHVLPRLAEDGELMAFQHEGYWQCMDTIREKEILEEIWTEGSAPWKLWQ